MPKRSSDSFLLRDFQQDQEPVLRERVNIILLLGALLVPLFSLADYFLYPDHLMEFVTYRFVTSGCCAFLYGVNRYKDIGGKSYYLGVAALYIVGLCIVRMIVVTGGYTTPYYAGLNLVFLGFGVVMPAQPSKVIPHCIGLYIIYLICVTAWNQPTGVPIFFVNNMFILFTLAIVFVASHASHSLRWMEYTMRQELEHAQRQLERYSQRLEHEVVESEEKYRAVVDHANDAIFVSQDDVITFANPRTETLLGYTAHDLQNISFASLVVPEDRALLDRKSRQEPVPNGRQTPSFRIIRKDGELLWCEMSSVPMEWEGSSGALHIVRDITERKRMEEKLIRAQKREAIGTLAGGIAHDFNNILQAISGHLELLLRKKSTGDPDYESLVQIDKASQEAAKLVRQLLIYGRQWETKFDSVDLNQQVVQTCTLLKRVIPRMITIDLRLAGDLEKVRADPVQLEQIIMNLAVNARDAMPEGGNLVIETRNVRPDERLAQVIPGTAENSYARLRVSDTGHGMADETLKRIFDPFFTMKGPGEGTGLGLATVHALVESHRGHITCNSEPGAGTTFDIYLPVMRGKTKKDERGIFRLEDLSGNQETILVIDDEESIRNLGQKMLEGKNYKVLLAENGEKAIEILQGKTDRVDLIIADLNMPGMGGYKLLKKLREMQTDAKVVVATGYLNGDKRTDIEDLGTSGWIAKPFRYSELLKTIKEILSES